MPELVCPSCGKQVFTAEPLESLFEDERRCPRCGAELNQERRQLERRDRNRRENAPHDPGPPFGEERRVEDRRKNRRRGWGNDSKKRSDWGWKD